MSIHVEDLYEISEETVDHSYRYDYSSSGIFSTKQSVPIHYSEIVEKNNDFKTYYQYNSPSVPLMQIKSTFPYIPVFTHDYHRKKIRKKIKYTYLNNKYKTIEKDIYQYKIFNGDHIQPLKIGKLNFINEISSPGSAEWVCDEMLFKCADYQILNVEKKLSSKKTTHFFYDDFGELKDSSNKSQTYKYNSETLNLKQTRTINEEDTLTDKYYYLSDFDENLNTNYIGNFDLLENKNLLYKPIKIENYYNSTLSDAKVIQYNEDCKKKAIYKLNKRTDNQDDYHSDFIIDNDFFEEQIGFDYYDNSKRLKQVNTKQNDIITYLWGYNWLYPVSRITGKSFDEVSSKLTNLGYSINSIQSFSDQELNNVMIQLREQIECGMVESFNYKILKGLIRSFDANGNEKTYHYDELGRLKRILDNNQKIIKEFDYNYNQIFFNIYLSSNSEGTVNPSGKKSFPYGSDVTYDFIPNTGYKIDSVLIDGKMRGTFSSYTFSDITENHSLEVIFNPKEYNINIYQNNGGTVDLLDPAPYHYNNQVQVNIVPEEGYYVDQILIDGESVTPQNTFSFTVTDNHDIEVSFSKIQYNISIDHSSGGSVNPSGNQIIYYGESITLEFNPEIDYLESYSEDGSITIPDDPSVIEMIYEVADVRIDGEWIGPVYSYTFNNIKEPHDVYVSFQKKTFTISETHNNGGTVNPSGTNTFNYGSTAIYNFSPNQDYSIGEVFVDGTSVGSVSSYQFSDIVSDHSIDVNFNLNEYEINVYALNTNLGNITYTVQPGENLTINIAPDYNYSITSVEVDGVDQGPITSYTFEEIHSSHTVTVYTIYTGGSGGFIHP